MSERDCKTLKIQLGRKARETRQSTAGTARMKKIQINANHELIRATEFNNYDNLLLSRTSNSHMC